MPGPSCTHCSKSYSQDRSLLSAVVPADYLARYMEMALLQCITLTTVGYRDIVPHFSATRTSAALEAIVGQIYLTVLIGRLVGLHIVHGQKAASGRSRGSDQTRHSI